MVPISYAYTCYVFIITVKPNTKEKLCMATMLLFYIVQNYCIISYHLFSFRGSVQDYKIHIDMEIVKFT